MSVLAGPGSPPLSDLADLGIARVSYGPWTHRVALTALVDLGAELLAGQGAIPTTTRPLA